MKTVKFSSTEVDKFRSTLIKKLMDDVCQTAVSIVVASSAVTVDEVNKVLDGICERLRNRVLYVAPQPPKSACTGTLKKEN